MNLSGTRKHRITKLENANADGQDGSTLTHAFYTAFGKAGLVRPLSRIPKAACLNHVCSRASALFWFLEFPIPLPRVLGDVDFASRSGWCGLHACEFYVIIGLIPTGGVLLSLPGRWQPCCGCLPNRESPGNVHWETDPGPASGSFNFANPNGGVRRWEKPGVFTNLQRQDPKWMSLP